jgi:hypothetical protein
MEARGNSPAYPAQCVQRPTLPFRFLKKTIFYRGINFVRGSLNWGPLTWLNAVWKTYGWWTMRRTTYADDFHTYALEWTQDFL